MKSITVVPVAGRLYTSRTQALEAYGLGKDFTVTEPAGLAGTRVNKNTILALLDLPGEVIVRYARNTKGTTIKVVADEKGA